MTGQSVFLGTISCDIKAELMESSGVIIDGVFGNETLLRAHVFFFNIWDREIPIGLDKVQG